MREIDKDLIRLAKEQVKQDARDARKRAREEKEEKRAKERSLWIPVAEANRKVARAREYLALTWRIEEIPEANRRLAEAKAARLAALRTYKAAKAREWRKKDVWPPGSE